jgi:hypothetical protein
MAFSTRLVQIWIFDLTKGQRQADSKLTLAIRCECPEGTDQEPRKRQYSKSARAKNYTGVHTNTRTIATVLGRSSSGRKRAGIIM